MNVLAVGAHPDDIELGCGGTLAAHVAAGDRVTMLVMTDGQSGPGSVSQRICEQEQSARLLGVDLIWGNIPDGVVGNHEQAALRVVETALQCTGATRIYTHGEHDSHQDHRSVSLVSFGAARNICEVLAYDSPSSRHFTPNLYIDISATLVTKIASLQCHESQVAASPHVDIGFVRAQAVYRGGLVRTGAAEGFVLERMVQRIGGSPEALGLDRSHIPADTDIAVLPGRTGSD